MAKYSLATAWLLAATFLGAGPGLAAEGRWCAIVGVGTGSVREICHFRSFAECQAEVISGNRGTCGNNPRYVGGRSSGWRPVHKAKRKHRHRR